MLLLSATHDSPYVMRATTIHPTPTICESEVCCHPSRSRKFAHDGNLVTLSPIPQVVADKGSKLSDVSCVAVEHLKTLKSLRLDGRTMRGNFHKNAACALNKFRQTDYNVSRRTSAQSCDSVWTAAGSEIAAATMSCDDDIAHTACKRRP